MLVDIAKQQFLESLFVSSHNVYVGLYKANSNSGALNLTQLHHLTVCTFPGYLTTPLYTLGHVTAAIDSHDQGYTLSSLVSFIANTSIVSPETVLGVFISWQAAPGGSDELFMIQPLSPSVTVAVPGDGITFKLDLDAQDLTVLLPH
jgi:hypothetical protein